MEQFLCLNFQKTRIISVIVQKLSQQLHVNIATGTMASTTDKPQQPTLAKADHADSEASGDVASAKPEQCPEAAPAQDLKQGWSFWAVILTLCFTSLLGSFENAVVSTSMPYMIQDLSIGTNYVWITNGFFVARYEKHSSSYSFEGRSELIFFPLVLRFNRSLVSLRMSLDAEGSPSLLWRSIRWAVAYAAGQETKSVCSPVEPFRGWVAAAST